MPTDPPGVTAAIEALCAELDVRPVWAQLNAHPPTPLTVQLVLLASRMAAGVHHGTHQQAHINAVLDGQQSRDGAETHARLAIDMAVLASQSVDQAREILGDLLAAGLVR